MILTKPLRHSIIPDVELYIRAPRLFTRALNDGIV
jgi:hypothetical protein